MQTDDERKTHKLKNLQKHTMGTKDKNNISIILKVIVAVATAILGVFGVNAAI